MLRNLAKTVVRITAGSILAALFPVSSALAALPAMPSSGACAVLVTNPVPYGATIDPTNGYGPTTYNTTAVLTFTGSGSGNITIYSTNVVYTTTGIHMYSVPTSASSGTFTSAQNPDLPGAYLLTITVTSPVAGPPTVMANVIPVNGGNTLLVQGVNGPASGVCQFF